MVNRTLTVIALVLLFVLAGGGLVLYLAYGLQPEVPRRVAVLGLDEAVEVGWTRSGTVTIEAGSEAGAYAGLGFAHATRHTWPLLLWRQVGLGRLAEWFGNDLLVVDQFVRRLGLGALAREAYAQLPAEEQRLLQAYASGVNAGLGRSERALQDDLVLFDVQPEPWAPWHALAVERLFAWLATTPPSPDSLAHAGDEAVSFRETDRLLRAWMHNHGFENSLAWSATDSAGTHFYQRHVYGASALPLFQEVTLASPEAPAVAGATLLGTPFFAAGRTDQRAWALLFKSTASIRRVVRDTAQVPVSFDRLVSPDGSEHLLAVQRSEQGIFFETPEAAPAGPADTSSVRPDSASVRPDSAWVLEWPGFAPVSDWPAWRALRLGTDATFRILDGSGLQVGADGSAQVLGTPAVVRRLDAGVLVSNSPWAVYAATQLDSLLDGPSEGTRRLVDNHFSPWAARTAPPLIRDASAVPDQPEAVREALTFLRNWDFYYDEASIGASIFDTWLGLYRDSLGRRPDPALPDSLRAGPVARYRLLVQAVDTLAARFGTNQSQWRWENVQPRRYYFPAWSADTLLQSRPRLLPRTRYAPLSLPGRGHPSTLDWGPSPVQTGTPAPAAWEAWLSTDAWDAFSVRRYLLDTHAFLGRYLLADRPPTVVTLSADAPRYRTTALLPSDTDAAE